MVTLKRATVHDAELIYRMQRKAFAGLLAKYQDLDTNPGNEPFDKVQRRLAQPDTYFYLIQADKETVGAIAQERGNCHLYKKMGYHVTGEAHEVKEGMTLIVYEK